MVLLDGTAEMIPLAAGSVDGVVVAQAFHWFDAIRALSEIHRVLRPGGRLVLAWNRRDESVPWVRAMGDRIRLMANDEPQVRDGHWRAALTRCALFDAFESHHFRQVQRLSIDGIHDRVASVSFVAAASPESRASALADIDAILAADPTTAGHASVDLPYDTEIMSAVARSPSPGDEGTVASVNVNAGGVPKPPIDGARIGPRGLDGDGHTEPEPVHGGPDAAVCLYAQEAIERVRADGHQAFPGGYGENLTLLGLDWAGLRRGDRIAVGDGDTGPLLELTDTATPCQTLAHWFVEGRIARVSERVHPEDTRWYARVLRDGLVAPGMPVLRLASADNDERAQYPLRRTHGGTMPDPATTGNRPAPAGRGRAAPTSGGHAAPATREQLLVEHAAARRRRNAATLGGPDWEQASADVGRIEVEIARLERAMDPPSV